MVVGYKEWVNTVERLGDSLSIVVDVFYGQPPIARLDWGGDNVVDKAWREKNVALFGLALFMSLPIIGDRCFFVSAFVEHVSTHCTCVVTEVR